MEQKAKKELPHAFADLIASGKKQAKDLKYGTGNAEFVVKIDPLPSVAKRTEAIEMATDLVFSFESGIGGYITSLLSFAKKYAVLACFTDIDFEFDLDDIWTLVNATTLHKDVVAEVGEKAIEEFIYELNELIEANKGAKMRSVNIDSILARLAGIVSDISLQFKNVDMHKVLSRFQNLSDSIKGDDLLKKIVAIAKGED